jgi:SAM-dependent methyltransferase
MNGDVQSYLRPYARAARQHGGGFKSLLWASPHTQRQRFEALARAVDFAGKNVLDLGCGRADLLQYLIDRGTRPAHYVGLEALQELIDAARAKNLPNSLIIKADFVREPARMLVGADIVVFCGSLNTLDKADFYSTLRHAYAAAGEVLVFNYLCSSRLAGAAWLTWHRSQDVLAFVGSLSSRYRTINDYIDGDCTVAVERA